MYGLKISFEFSEKDTPYLQSLIDDGYEIDVLDNGKYKASATLSYEDLLLVEQYVSRQKLSDKNSLKIKRHFHQLQAISTS